jgi:hypothetical protein
MRHPHQKRGRTVAQMIQSVSERVPATLEQSPYDTPAILPQFQQTTRKLRQAANATQ